MVTSPGLGKIIETYVGHSKFNRHQTPSIQYVPEVVRLSTLSD